VGSIPTFGTKKRSRDCSRLLFLFLSGREVYPELVEGIPTFGTKKAEQLLYGSAFLFYRVTYEGHFFKTFQHSTYQSSTFN
jgi:hypothetical protein